MLVPEKASEQNAGMHTIKKVIKQIEEMLANKEHNRKANKREDNK